MKCPYCKFKHHDPRVIFGEHKRTHYPRVFKCPVGDYETDSPESLAGHLLSKHQASKMEIHDIIEAQMIRGSDSR